MNRHGIDGQFQAKTFEEIFDEFVIFEPNTGCWLWMGTIDRGYGRVHYAERTWQAHILVYETLVGPIPAGLNLDHLCHNTSNCLGGDTCIHRRCVNPQHVEPVTSKVNLLRGKTLAAENAAKTHCPRGHSLSGDNVQVAKRGESFYRRCRRCHLQWDKDHRRAIPSHRL